jgi:HAD superfamily hydrolase (TIGR01509 family)
MTLPPTCPAFLFDFNGVLVDDERVHLAAFQQTFGPEGIDIDEQTYWQRYLGSDDFGAAIQILQDAGRVSTPDLVARFVDLKAAAYLQLARSSLEVFDGAARLVAEVAGLGTVGIVSGALRHEVELGLEQLGVSQQVSFIVAAEDTRACKPDPEGYLLALARLKSDAGAGWRPHAVVIEDSVAGVHAAKAAGLACAAVGHSYGLAELADAGADLVVDHIRALDARRLAALARGAAL